ncbi:MAG: (E)-4-hydroxy-3-methylbut-2-enyl-diphosphate synthase [Clostridiales bacterium]|nr:(E)-4-hydroxy-3-methylbut-2-enyl-diphosphate synthase [Clostridiales bacterium]
MKYSLNYSRRATWPVKVGQVTIGGGSPVKIQSMTSTSTMDTEGSAAQTERIAAAGGEIVRLTAQGVREAANLAEIKKVVREHGVDVPLVADIHFNPKAAFEAALHVEKVRINPGNFVDPGRVFKHIDYTDSQYAAEQDRIAATLIPFLELCRANGTAVRIGVNHGSLSDRIMSRYGDTPAGMVESAMEFLRVAVSIDFKDIVISIKASNTVVMVETVRRLVKAMDSESMQFPLHLGVTEAGDGDDGRIKSAVGIGTLLAHGIGDTIRVSLSEEPECEIPVARELVGYITARGEDNNDYTTELWPGYNPLVPRRYPSRKIGAIGGDNRVAALNGDHIKEAGAKICHIDADQESAVYIAKAQAAVDCVLSVSTMASNVIGAIESAIHNMRSAGIDNPIVARLDYAEADEETLILRAAADAGTLLLDAVVDGIDISAAGVDVERVESLERDILQAARCRFEKTEFISCPSCGRTLFDLQATVREVKEAIANQPGLKIGIMGCIVNGPGEMADADYGYVGAAAGKVSLYRGKECVERNIPREEALQHLVALIKSDGRWNNLS